MAQDPFDTLPLARPAVTPAAAPASPTKEPGDPWDTLPVVRPAVTAGGPPPAAPTSPYLQSRASQYGVPLSVPPPPVPLSKTATPARTPIGAPGADTSVYQDTATRKAAGEDLTGHAIRFGLEVAAPLAATAFVGPGGGLATRAAVAGLGMAGGTAVAEGVNELRGQAPPAPLDFLKDVGISGLVGAGGEVVATGLAAGWRGIKNAAAKYAPAKITAPMAGRVTDAGRDAELLLGDDISPGQVTDSKRLGILDTIASGGLTSKTYAQLRQRQTAKLLDRMKTLLSPYGQVASRDEAGKVISDALESEAAGRTASSSGALQSQAAAGKAQAAGLESQAALRTRLASEASELAAGARTEARATVGGSGRPAEEAGTRYQQAIKLAHQAAKDETAPLYDAIDRSGVMVPLQPLRDFVDQDIAREGAHATLLRGGSAPAVRRAAMAQTPEEIAAAEAAAATAGTSAAEQNVRNAASGGSGTRLRELQDNPRYAELNALLGDVARETGTDVEAELTFKQAHALRSALGQRIRAARIPTSPDHHNLGFLQQAFKTLDQSMTESATAAGSDIRKTYDQATAMWKDMVATFEDGVLADAVDKDPRLVMDTIIKPGREADILKARAKVGETAWKGIAATHLDDLLTDANGWVTGKELNARLEKLTPGTLRAIYGDEGGAHITEYLKRVRSQEGLSEAAGNLRAAAGKVNAGAEKAASKAAGLPAAPEPIYASLASSLNKETDLRKIAKLKLLTGKDFTTVQSAHMDALFKGKGGHAVLGKDLMGELHDYGPERLAAIYGQPTADKLFQLARVMEAVEKQGSGLFKYALPAAQLMGVIDAGSALATGDLSQSRATRVAALLAGPHVLARVMMDTTARQWLTTGLKAQLAKDPKMFTRAVSQLTAWMTKEGIIHLPGQGKGGGSGASAFERVAPIPRTTGKGGGAGPNTGGPPAPLPR